MKIEKKVLALILSIVILLTVIGLLVYYYFSQQAITAMAYVDEDQNPNFLACINNPIEENMPETVSLYTLGLGTEKETISDSALKGEYLSYNNNERILFLENNTLYLKSPSVTKEKISDQVVASSYKFSGDGQNVIFLRTGENDLNELYVYNALGEKEKIASDLPLTSTKKYYDINHDGTIVMYKNHENSLFLKKKDLEKEKIASDVDVFTLYSEDSFSYLTYANSYYVKYANDVETQKVNNESIGTLRICNDGLSALYLGDFNFEKGCGELYICTRGNESIKLASSITKFEMATNGSCVYYTNDEDMLFKKELPEINEKTVSKSSLLYDKIVNGEKTKISSSIIDYQISPTSKMLLYLDSENNLFYFGDNEKIKLSGDVSRFKLFENSYTYMTLDNNLYRNNVLDDIQNHKTNTQLLSENVLSFSTSTHGDYVTFANAETDEMFATFRDNQPKQVILDCKEYNTLLYYGVSVYERTLKFKDIIGNYENEELNEMYAINNEHIFTLYRNGVQADSSKMTIEAVSEHSVRIIFSHNNEELGNSEYIISKSEENTYGITVNGTDYALNIVEEKAVSDLLAKHVEIGEERKKEEERLARVENARAVGESYVQNGITLSGNYREYRSTNYSSALSGEWPLNGYYYVYDYSPTSDGNYLWLKIYDYGYYWILIGV